MIVSRRTSLLFFSSLLIIGVGATAGSPKQSDALSEVKAGWEAFGFGQLKDSLAHLRNAQSLSLKAVGENHRDYASVIVQLAKYLEPMGELEEAASLVEQAYNVQLVQLGANSSDVAESLSLWGKVLGNQGKYSQSVEKLKKALGLQQAMHGSNSLPAANTKIALGSVYISMGMLSAAKPLLAGCLKTFEGISSADPAGHAETLNQLGLLEYGLERYPESIALHRRALLIQETHLTKYHPDIRATVNHLIGAFYHVGEFSEIADLYKGALDLSLELHGAEHASSITLEQNLQLVNDYLSSPALGV